MTVVPGCRCWKLDPSWVKVPVSDDAADTVIEPDSRVAEVDVVVPVEAEEEHAVAIAATSTRDATVHARTEVRLMAGRSP
jgi:hypothetical protein